MTPSDFTTALATLGLDNHQAAQWLGVSVKSVRRYRVSGAPGPVAGMVRLAVKLEKAKNGDLTFPDRKPRLWTNVPHFALDWRE